MDIIPVSVPEKKAEIINNSASTLNNSHSGVSSKEYVASIYLRPPMVYKFCRNGNSLNPGLGKSKQVRDQRNNTSRTNLLPQ